MTLDKVGLRWYHRDMKYEKVYHTLPPVYDERSRVIVLGSLPSPKSRETGFYYGHPQNRFWRVLSDVLGEPFPADNDERRDMALRRGIALWDVIAECEIAGASDASIRSAVPNDFSVITRACDVRAVFTVGRTATALYEKFTGERSIYLPGPSGANRAVSYERMRDAYSVITGYLDPVT